MLGKKIEMQEFCSYCDIPLGSLADKPRRPAKFCSEAHRVLYHNTIRKIDNRLSIMLTDLKFFAEHTRNEYGLEIQLRALKTLRTIQTMTGIKLYSVVFSCGKCGQTRMDEPIKGDKCAFCDCDNQWKIDYNKTRTV